MAPLPGTPRQRPTTSRSRSTRPKSSDTQQSDSILANSSSEPPHKKRKYIPGGPGGGGRYVDEEGNELPVGGTGPGGYNYIGSRGRVGRQNAAIGLVPEVFNRKDRGSRSRTVLPRSKTTSMRYSSAAQVAAVAQSDGYKPREERAWEEFHPHLDIDVPLRAFSESEVQGVQAGALSISGKSKEGQIIDSEGTNAKNGGVLTDPAANICIPTFCIPGTPGGGKRRPGRPPKDPVAFFAAKAAKLGKCFSIGTLKIPNNANLSVYNNPKEKLTLPQPSYRKSKTLARFEDRALGLVKYVDKSMANIGYQESDIFVRPERTLIKSSDINFEEDLEFGSNCKSDFDGITANNPGGVGRVEYDMDEQDDKWLEAYNIERIASGVDKIPREIFEITITKIEKEWHNLEKRIPKPSPRPPQTHRPRSSSAAAVNGEAQSGEEQDSKCAICDDGDCENTNAIVFCDGCDLAVHQECYGVPFIPEGQWLCRKCQLIGRGVPTCIFCPNTDGAFKQTTSSKWAHLLCAMWIPEVSLGNHTFMEPVMEVEKVPKTRWKLNCYLCNQRMGACIQCGNKSCYQAFHVTCARKARLFLKMKNTHGSLSVLDGTTNMKAYCDKHCPADWIRENDVITATRDARAFYKKSMRGRLWADSHTSALEMAANYCHATPESQQDESRLTGIKVTLNLGDSKKKINQPQKPVWKLPSGAPVIPFCVFEKVEKSLGRFNFQKRKDFTADVCRYWTLKREARRGAALLKRLQLQMETFSSLEITRRNFAGMGPAGKPRLKRRIDFAKTLMKDIENLRDLLEDVVKRETEKLDAANLEADFVDKVYFPVAKLFPPVIEHALTLDIKNLFTEDLAYLQQKVEVRFFTSVLPFAQNLSDLFRKRVTIEPKFDPNMESSSIKSKNPLSDIKERRKLAKRILSKAVQPQLENAIRVESEISGTPAKGKIRELIELLDSVWQTEPQHSKKLSHLTNYDTLPNTAPVNENMGLGSSSPEIPKITAENHFSADSCIHGPNRKQDIESSASVSATKSRVNFNKTTSTIDTTPGQFEIVNGPISQLERLRTRSISPSSLDCSLQTKDPHPGPPTPPVSNSDTGILPDDVLSAGGVPWVFDDFKVEGTTALPEKKACFPSG
ncbi:BgTH12-06478 [Blumeria graminis f. sp. triticale]|uniref:BgTH12-06478 n=42 Tax=Blumeria TaxID=34372 RepID=A0A9W4CYM7_BLUGR|nr:BgTH12-06478 [Blumeria graminis f. sp. triticale]